MKHQDPCRGRGPFSQSKEHSGVRCDFFVLDGSRLSVCFADIDSALEERAVLDADASCGYVAGQRAFCTDVNAISGRNVALQFAEHDDFASADTGVDYAVLTHRHAITRNVDATLNLAINEQRFCSGDLALDGEALADGGLLAGGRGGRGCGRARRLNGWLHGSGANWLWGLIRGRLALLGRFPHSAQDNFLFCPFRTRVPRQGPRGGPRNLELPNSGNSLAG